MKFKENKDKTAILLQKLNNDYRAMFIALDTKGVFVDKAQSIAALDFAKAKTTYHIEGLP